MAEAFQPDMIVSELFVAAAGHRRPNKLVVPLVVAGWPALERKPTAAIRLVGLARTPACGADAWRLGCTAQLDADRSAGRFRPPAPDLLEPLLVWAAGAPAPQTDTSAGSPPRGPLPTLALPSPDQLPWVLITLGHQF